eukprot:Rmarinus@m.22342
MMTPFFYLEQLLETHPTDIDVLTKLGAVQRRRHEYKESLRWYERALEVDPQAEMAYVGLAMMLMDAEELGGAAEAEKVLFRGLDTIKNPKDRIFATTGHLYAEHIPGRKAEALEWYRKALERRPGHADYYVHLAILTKQTGDDLGAMHLYDRAVELDPYNYPALLNSAEILDKHDRRFTALERIERAVTELHGKDDDNVLMSYAMLLSRMNRAEEAVSWLMTVIERNSSNIEAYSKLGDAFYEMGHYENAIRAAEFAAINNETDYHSRYVLGRALKELKRNDEATVHFVAGMFLEYSFLKDCHLFNPEGALGILFLGSDRDPMEWRDWRAREYCTRIMIEHEMHKSVRDARHKVQPLTSTILDLPLPYYRILAEFNARGLLGEWAEPRNKLMFSHRGGGGFRRPGGANGQLRVAFMSADYRQHPVCYLVRDLIGAFDPRTVEVFAYGLGPNEKHACRDQVEAGATTYVHVEDMSVVDTAELIYEHRINILVDLTGHTHNHRLQALALRPAPVNVHALGYPGTIGSPDLTDYYIGDNIASMPEHVDSNRADEMQWSESLALLPYSYQINSRVTIPDDKVSTKVEAGFPEDAFVFTSMSQPFKVDPTIFAVWMNILHRVPGSVLWMFPTREAVRDVFKAQAASSGIHPDRILFLESVERIQHLGRLQHADLALDTRTYGLHTTAADCFSRSVPVITNPEFLFARRVAASVSTAIGTPSMVTAGWRQYEEQAVLLALSSPKYRSLVDRGIVPRDSLPDDMPFLLDHLRDPLPEYDLPGVTAQIERGWNSYPLFDGKLYAKYLENAMWQMWDRSLSGLPPTHITVQNDVHADGLSSLPWYPAF